MPERDPQDVSVTEAEWHLAASEYRVYLAMRQRSQGDASIGHEGLSRLFDDLADAIAQHRAAVSGGADAEANEPAGDAMSGMPPRREAESRAAHDH